VWAFKKMEHKPQSKKSLLKNKPLLFSAIVIILLVVIIAYLVYKPSSNNSNTPEQLAKCLTEKGIKMYGSIYCPHCAAQKALFGDAFKFVNYVECTNAENSNLCSGLMGVPAWDIQGQIYYGKQELSKLKELSGC